jgi:minimal CRISPR polymerase domain
MGRPQYVLLDGDQVGRRMEDLLLRDALPPLYFLVQDLNDAVLVLARVFRKVGGLVYLCGGDTVLGSVENVYSLLAALQPIRGTLPCTFSAGVGSSVSDALIALKLAKARGPAAVVRVRRVGGVRRSAHWEDPDGWREERPAQAVLADGSLNRPRATRGRPASRAPRRQAAPTQARPGSSGNRGAAASSRRRGWA